MLPSNYIDFQASASLMLTSESDGVFIPVSCLCHADHLFWRLLGGGILEVTPSSVRYYFVYSRLGLGMIMNCI